MHNFVDVLFVIIQRKSTGTNLYVINSYLVACFPNLTFTPHSSWPVENVHAVANGPRVEVLSSLCPRGASVSLSLSVPPPVLLLHL